MEERFGVKGTVQDGVFFTESPGVAGEPKGSVTVEINRQNANLFDVKAKMAAQARSRGADVIAGFTYGQKKHYFRVWDSEHWFGKGTAISTGEFM